MNRIVFLFFLLLAFFGNTRTYYVSKEGKNTNPGNKAAPFQTIQFAINKLKAGDVCYVRKGIYREQLIFKKNGTKNQPIQLIGFPKEKVVITPTFKTNHWSKHTKNIYKTPITNKVLQVFVDGKPSMQACYPNLREGELSTKRWGNIYASSDKSVIVQGIEKFGNLNGSHFVGICGRGLVALYGKVVHSQKSKIRVENKAFYWAEAHKTAYLGKGKGFLVGKYAFLDNQGEWFQDENYLYYYSKEKLFDPSIIEIRTKQAAIVLKNKKYMSIKGFHLIGGSLEIDNSSHCSIDQVKIDFPTPFFTFDSGFDRYGGKVNGIDYDQPKNWSGKGVIISGKLNRITNSIIQHSWGDGLTVWGNKHLVKNCIISDCDWIGIDCAPLNITGDQQRVIHCSLSKTARSVLVHRKLTRSKIEHNEISEGGILNDDLGLTYTYDTDGKGTEIAYNWIHDNYAKRYGGGIYLDNNHKNFSVHHNVVWNCFVGMVINQKAENDRIYNNSFIHNKYSMGACRPDGGALDFTNIYSYNNITDSELKARDHDIFYGTKQVNNHFVPHLSNLMVNPTERQFQLRKNTLLSNNLGANTSEIQGVTFHPSQSTRSTFHFLLFTFYFLLIAFFLVKTSCLRISSLSNWKNIGLFVGKVLGAFSIYWMYTYYYPNRETADIFKYFDDANTIYHYVYADSFSDYVKFLFGMKVDTTAMNEAFIHTNYWLRQTEIGTIGDNHVMIKTHAFILLFSGGYYPIHLLFFAFFSYVGSVLFYRFILTIFEIKEKVNYVLIVLFLTPSVFFFCSGTLKETLIYTLFLYTLAGTYTLLSSKKYWLVIPILLSVYLLFILKVYLLIAIIPGFVSFLLFTKWKTPYWWIYTLLIHFVYLYLLFEVPSVNFMANLQFKQNDLILVANEMHAGSKIELPILDGTYVTLLKAIPNAIYNVFLLPSPANATSIWMWLSVIENHLLLGLLLVAGLYVKNTNRQQRVYLAMIVSFCVLLAVFIGWTVPIIGAIVRYKVMILALLLPSLIGIIHLGRNKKNR